MSLCPACGAEHRKGRMAYVLLPTGELERRRVCLECAQYRLPHEQAVNELDRAVDALGASAVARRAGTMRSATIPGDRRSDELTGARVMNYAAKDRAGRYWCGAALGWVTCRFCAVRMDRKTAHLSAHGSGLGSCVVRIVKPQSHALVACDGGSK